MTLPELTEAQVNIILTALGQRPFVEVYDLMQVIARHIEAQKNPPAPAPPDLKVVQ